MVFIALLGAATASLQQTRPPRSSTDANGACGARATNLVVVVVVSFLTFMPATLGGEVFFYAPLPPQSIHYNVYILGTAWQGNLNNPFLDTKL